MKKIKIMSAKRIYDFLGILFLGAAALSVSITTAYEERFPQNLTPADSSAGSVGNPGGVDFGNSACVNGVEKILKNV